MLKTYIETWYKQGREDNTQLSIQTPLHTISYLKCNHSSTYYQVHLGWNHVWPHMINLQCLRYGVQ